MEASPQELLSQYSEIRECDFKERHYSVRDNGAIYRHPKKDCRPSKLDCIWTFGSKDNKTGYMLYGGVRVHQIVATAFHGTPDDPHMVIDHKDTNRCNNRPENLARVTRLENALNNPITRNKIKYLCGSIEAFLEDPSILRESASDPNTGWMRTVSKEEAAKCLKNLERWAKEDNTTPKSTNESKGIGEWIYQDSPDSGLGSSWNLTWDSKEIHKSYAQQRAEIEAETARHYEEQLSLKESLTPGAKQIHWKVPTEFPLCPNTHTETPLQDYIANLNPTAVFCQNQYYHSEVIKAELSLDKTHIAVLTTTSGVTNFALTEIRYEDGFYIHESIRTFFTEEGAEKYYTLSLGKEWAGGDVLEDYC